MPRDGSSTMFCLCPTIDQGCPCNGSGQCVEACADLNAPSTAACAQSTSGTCTAGMALACACVFMGAEGVASGICRG
jgi:hypothetical protein